MLAGIHLEKTRTNPLSEASVYFVHISLLYKLYKHPLVQMSESIQTLQYVVDFALERISQWCSSFTSTPMRGQGETANHYNLSRSSKYPF